ncbi:heavy metal sensor histidine kinase [Franconibacter helveticus 513]|uniref:heavy metal sensor histidine kinase n=1 Tax=Franconibacter helveticus TaxID=357240 RepID=UPI00040079CF|nr:heavy metal sensor histidine kinase [Franconibacter helveticus]
MRRPSLTLRLTLAFTLLVALCSALVSVSLYRALAGELVWRDNQTLLNRGAQLRQLLLDGAEPRSLPLYFNRMMDTRQDILRISRPDGRVIVDINQAKIAVPTIAPSAPGAALSEAALQTWLTPQGVTATGMALTGRDAQGPVVIMVARVAAEREQVLEAWRRKSFYISLGAMLLAVIASPLLIRRSLGAIRKLSRQTAQTHSLALEPLPLNTLPAELLPLGRSLNIMRQRLAEDFTRLTQFADDLAHELRTPVNILLGQNQVMLQQSRSTNEYEALLAGNIEELEQMTRLIENILFLSRADHRNVALEKRPLDAAAFIQATVDFLEPLAEENHLRFATQAQGELFADRLLLQRTLTNLLTNALRHTEPGGQIKISVHHEETTSTLTVANPGEPISEPQNLFRRFWRADNARHTPGAGLGLAISQAIVKLHGGELVYRHQQGWNCFIVMLPAVSTTAKS